MRYLKIYKYFKTNCKKKTYQYWKIPRKFVFHSKKIGYIWMLLHMLRRYEFHVIDMKIYVWNQLQVKIYMCQKLKSFWCRVLLTPHSGGNYSMWGSFSLFHDHTHILPSHFTLKFLAVNLGLAWRPWVTVLSK